jgi:hypothetical protein
MCPSIVPGPAVPATDAAAAQQPSGCGVLRPRDVLDVVHNAYLIALGRCGIGLPMHDSVRIVRDMTMNRFGRAVEDVVR